MRNKREVNEDQESEEDEIYEVEQLMDHRVVKQGGKRHVMYLIKWKNYDEDSSTWEKEQDIYSQKVIDEYWERIGKSREEATGPKTLKRKRPTAQGKAPITAPNTRTRTRSTGSTSSSSSASSSSESEDVPDTSNDSSIRSQQVSIKPPSGLKWSDATKIVHIYADTNGNLVGRVSWSNGTESYILTSLLRDVKPTILFEYYESHLQFGPIDEE